MAKHLTPGQILQIVEDYTTTNATQAELADRYGVTPVAMTRLLGDRRRLGDTLWERVEAARSTVRGNRGVRRTVAKKLTPEQVDEIRAALKYRTATYSELAARYGVSPSTLHAISSGRSYTDVQPGAAMAAAEARAARHIRDLEITKAFFRLPYAEQRQYGGSPARWAAATTVTDGDPSSPTATP